MQEKKLNWENFNDRARHGDPVVSTPRSLEACKRLGIEPEEAIFITRKQI